MQIGHSIVCSLVLSRLEYCNSILSGSPKCLIKKLQRVQNTAARMPRTEHTTPLLRMLHWLPIPSRIAYKIDSLCHTALTSAYPKYLSKLLTVYTPARPLRSSLDPNILNIAARTKSYGQRAFAYQGPINWNRVPGSIRTVEEKDTFKRHLKTTLYFNRMHKISTLSHYHFILVLVCIIVQYYFHVTVSLFGSFVPIIYISLINMYYDCACVVTFCCCPILSTCKALRAVEY